MIESANHEREHAPGPLKLFFCYAHANQVLQAKLDAHLSSLKREGMIDTWFDGILIPGDSWNDVIKKQLDQADIIVLLVTPDFLKSKYIIEVELKRAIEREKTGGCRVIPVIAKPCDWCVPPLSRLHALPKHAKPVTDWRPADKAWEDIAKGIRMAAVDMLERRSFAKNGIVSRERLRESKRRFDGEVYAIELLEQPIRLSRDNFGKLCVTIDRSGVQQYIISNEGKRTMVGEFEIERKREAVVRRDKEIHAFLVGTETNDFRFDPVNELGLKLRWASGGVMSLVHIEGDPPDKRWVPFFFRDIPPYGWNIALGSAERWFDDDGNLEEDYSIQNELDEPENFILREFIEETMIVEGNPCNRRILPQRKLRIFDGHGSRAIPQGHRFGDEHRRLRLDKRDLDIQETGSKDIEVNPVRTNCELIVMRDGRKQSETDNVLVCFSLLDLGIEVVKVKRFEIAQCDCMLDGEIQPGDQPGSRELVRMPMALMSEAYLRRTFSSHANWQNYTSGGMPSIITDSAPSEEKGEIFLFPFDVARRKEILSNDGSSTWERHRYEGWMKNFEANFFKNGTPSAFNPSRQFVPGAAKILNLYFSAAD